MPIRHYTFDPPFAYQPNDAFKLNGESVEQWRNETLIDSRPAVFSLLNELAHIGSNQVSSLFVEVNVTQVSVTVVDVQHMANGSKLVVYSDGNSEELSPALLDLRSEAAQGMDAVKADISAYWKARSADYSSSTSIVGKTFQKDLSLELGQFQVGSVQ